VSSTTAWPRHHWPVGLYKHKRIFLFFFSSIFKVVSFY
jgi:hypothetical protein